MKITNNSTRALLWLLVQPVHSGEHTYFLVAWSEFARQRSVLVIIRNAGNTISRGFQRTLQVEWNCDERQTKLAQTDANVTDTDWLLYIALYCGMNVEQLDARSIWVHCARKRVELKHTPLSTHPVKNQTQRTAEWARFSIDPTCKEMCQQGNQYHNIWKRFCNFIQRI